MKKKRPWTEVKAFFLLERQFSKFNVRLKQKQQKCS
jgi:hypothetical protein